MSFWRSVWVSLTVLLTLVATGQVLVRQVGLFGYAQPEHTRSFERPQDWFVTPDGGGHPMYWHNQGGTIDAARQADLLFVGNSRCTYGFADDVVRGWAQKQGWKHYVLCVGHEERHSFFEALLQRHSLQPKLLVVDVGEAFFDPQISELAEAVMGGQHEGSFTTAEALGWRKLPHFIPPADGLNIGKNAEVLQYRRIQDGAVALLPTTTDRFAITLGQEHPPPKSMLVHAMGFMDALGAPQVVLTQVPEPGGNPGYLKGLSETLGVPSVAPTVPGLNTFDGSHLDPESARRFTLAFVAALDRLVEQGAIEIE